MAQREIPVAGVVPQVGDNGETGYQLDVGGGTTLPFTEEDLKKQGYKLSADKGSVLKADLVITGNLSTEEKQGAPVGETAEGKVDVIQPRASASCPTTGHLLSKLQRLLYNQPQ